MTDKEYQAKKRECWEEFLRSCRELNMPRSKFLFDWIFARAFTLGKQDKDADAVIQGWVARDGNGNLWTYTHKPIRSENPYWLGEVADFTLSNDILPDLTWESEPLEVEIIIKGKQK